MRILLFHILMILALSIACGTEAESPTATPRPTYTPQPTFTPVPTATLEPTATQRPTYTPQPNLTVSPTEMPTLVPPPTATPTPLPTVTPAPTPEPTPTPKPTARPTVTQTPRPTSTPTPTPKPKQMRLEIAAGDNKFAIKVPADWEENLEYGKETFSDAVVFFVGHSTTKESAFGGIVYARRATIRPEVSVEEFGRFMAEHAIENEGIPVVHDEHTIAGSEEAYIITAETHLGLRIAVLIRLDAWIWNITCVADQDHCVDIMSSVELIQ